VSRLVAAGLATLLAMPALAETPAVADVPRTPEQLQLDAAAIRGNQELPRVLYILPWQEPGMAELAGRPVNSLVEEVLAPVDREVFNRQTRYFDQLNGAREVARP